MKKIISILCILVLITGFTACNKAKTSDAGNEAETVNSGEEAEKINIYKADNTKVELTDVKEKEEVLQTIKKILFRVDEYEEEYEPRMYIYTGLGCNEGYEMLAYNSKREAISQSADRNFLTIYTSDNQKYMLQDETILMENQRTDAAQMIYDMFFGMTADDFKMEHVVPVGLEEGKKYIYNEDVYVLQFENPEFMEKYKSLITGVDIAAATIIMSVNPAENSLLSVVLSDEDGNKKRLFELSWFATTDDWSLPNCLYGGQPGYDEVLTELNDVLYAINRSTVQTDDRYSGYAMMPYELGVDEADDEQFHAAATGESIQTEISTTYEYYRNNSVAYGKYMGNEEDPSAALFPNTDHEVLEIQDEPYTISVYKTKGYEYNNTTIYDSNSEELLLSEQLPDTFSFISHALKEKREGYVYKKDNKGKFIVEISGEEAVRELYSYWGDMYEEEAYGSLFNMVKDENWSPAVRFEFTMQSGLMEVAYIAVNDSEEIPVWRISPGKMMAQDWKLDEWWYGDGAGVTDLEKAEQYLVNEIQKVRNLMVY